MKFFLRFKKRGKMKEFLINGTELLGSTAAEELSKHGHEVKNIALN